MFCELMLMLSSSLFHTVLVVFLYFMSLSVHSAHHFLLLPPGLTSPFPTSMTVSHCLHQSKLEHSSHALENAISLSVTSNPEDCPQCAAALSLREGDGAMGGEEDEEGTLEETDREENHLDERKEADAEHRGREKRRSCLGFFKDVWDEMRVKLWSIVESKYFNRGIMIAILINTISMGIEHHNQVGYIDMSHCVPCDSPQRHYPNRQFCFVLFVLHTEILIVTFGKLNLRLL